MRNWRLASIVLGSLTLTVAGVLTIGGRHADQRAAMLAAERALAPTRHGRIEYVGFGKGPPVLVVHGAGGGFDQGRLLAEGMGGGRSRFIAVSRFGYLGSALPRDPSTAAQAEAFSDLLDHLKIAKVSILAMSGGVPPALKFAEMFPARTNRLVLLSSAPFTPFGPDVAGRPLPTWAYTSLLGQDAVYWALTKAARPQLRRAFDVRPELVAGSSAREQHFVDALIDGFLPASARIAGVRNEGAAVARQAIYQLEKIRAPTMIVHAENDRLNPVAVARALGRRIPGAQLTVFGTGGHLLLGHHDELSNRIGRFLGDEK